MGNDSILQVVIKVKDEMTPIITKIGKGFAGFLSDATSAAKKFFTNFSAEAFGKVIGGIKKMGEMVAWAGAKFNEFAPDAKKYKAQFSVEEMLRLREGAEAFNRLGAAWDRFVGQLLSKGSLLTRFFDDITRRIKQVTDGPQLTEVGAAQARLQELRDKYRMFQGKPMTEAMLKSPYYQDMLKAEDEAIRQAEEHLRIVEARYAVRKKEVDAAKALMEEEAQLARNPGVAEALKSLRSIYRTSQEIEDTILLEDFQNAWEVAGRSVEWMNSQLEKQKELNASVADSLRGLKSMFREMAQFETDFWNEMWDELDAREKEVADNKKAALEKQIADLQAFYEKSSSIRAENAERLRQQMEAEIEAINQQIEQVAGIMSSAFLSSFEDVIRGTKSVADAFTQMVGSIMYDVGKMMASEALTGLFRDLLKGLYGGSSGANLTDSGIQGGSLDLPRYAPSTSGGRTGVTININGARDATAVAREVRTAVMNLASTDSGVRRRLQLS